MELVSGEDPRDHVFYRHLSSKSCTSCCCWRSAAAAAPPGGADRCGCDWQLRLRRRQQLLLSMQRRRGLGCHCCLPLRVLRQRAELCQQRAPVHLLLLRHAKTHQALALLLLLLLVLRLGPRLGLGLGARLEQRLERAARRAHHRRRRAGVQRGGGQAHHASGQ